MLPAHTPAMDRGGSFIAAGSTSLRDRIAAVRRGSGRRGGGPSGAVDCSFSLRASPRAGAFGRSRPIDHDQCACGAALRMRGVSPGDAPGQCDGCGAALPRRPIAFCASCDRDFCGQCTARAGAARGGGGIGGFQPRFQPRGLELESQVDDADLAGARGASMHAVSPTRRGAGGGRTGAAHTDGSRGEAKADAFRDVEVNASFSPFSVGSGSGAGVAHGWAGGDAGVESSMVWTMPSVEHGSMGAQSRGGAGGTVGAMVMLSAVGGAECSAVSELVVVEGTSAAGERCLVHVCTLGGEHRAVEGSGFHEFAAASVGHKVGVAAGVAGRAARYRRRGRRGGTARMLRYIVQPRIAVF